MKCAYCGYGLAPGATECSRCGGAVAGAAGSGSLGSDLFAPPPPAGSDLFDGPTAADPAPFASGSSSPSPPSASWPADDPEADLRTSMVSKDRQVDISTKLVEAAAPAKPPEVRQPRGLPDSRVARGVEDSLLEIKRLLFRMGRFGRFALWSHLLVILGSVSPWYYLPYEGFTPGLEAWGWLPLLLSLGGIGTLAWRHQPKTGMRVLPVLLHLLLAAALVLALLWRYQENQLTVQHLRPSLAFGFYIAGAGALGAALGALIGLKDVR